MKNFNQQNFIDCGIALQKQLFSKDKKNKNKAMCWNKKWLQQYYSNEYSIPS